SECQFKKFFSDSATQANPKAEFFIPLCVNELINTGKVSLKVLNSGAKWFGVTYKEDRPDTVAKIQALIDAGVYPSNLWGK
ncbi:MAG: nucleotidyltransferase, partial [Alistipes sp.]|nr:nucleotidyltransferase [Candidatus Minthomonas equi]